MFEGIFGILAFFGTVLGLIVGLVVIAISLLSHHPRRAGKAAVILLGWIGIYVALLLLFSLTSRARVIAAGEERCFDEMCFSVKAVTFSPTLGVPPILLTARGNFAIVTVQLRNAAKRTAQKPSEPELYVIDANGNRYTQAIYAGNAGGIPLGQPVTARQLWARPVQPGETVSQTVAFDLPFGVNQPGLVINEGVGLISVVIIGDENSLFHAKTEFQLTP